MRNSNITIKASTLLLILFWVVSFFIGWTLAEVMRAYS